MRHSLLTATILLSALCGCELLTPTQPHATTINVIATPDGKYVAIPPECPNWQDNYNSPFDNTPWPQFGCANARNLAMQVERPEDLLHGRNEGLANAEMTSAAMRRYLAGHTTDLVDPNSDSPTAKQTAGGGLSILSLGGSKESN